MVNERFIFHTASRLTFTLKIGGCKRWNETFFSEIRPTFRFLSLSFLIVITETKQKICGFFLYFDISQFSSSLPKISGFTFLFPNSHPQIQSILHDSPFCGSLFLDSPLILASFFFFFILATRNLICSSHSVYSLHNLMQFAQHLHYGIIDRVFSVSC